ncbi:Hypothetical protein AJAP_42680 (plasmid) [Amycolatopsis japonica]|uniref:Uncharacterized protein n=1 Tax=Amycolatopsis japonica TaxID=208439 RepID=A0A075V760_9PSEU|nr:hypothetical protein [Amycolatopsis japonica]AIG81303.1 Hypothetical protein AJAP_42680 [Amycolatopsis japonica]
MSSRQWAATRDASSYDRPDVRTTKRYHFAHVGKPFRTGQPMSTGAVSMSAVCSGALLDENGAIPARDVEPRLRCRRLACRNAWKEPDA